jgi:hypothetical protein
MIPRALCGSVRAMARPAIPKNEKEAVLDAASQLASPSVSAVRQAQIIAAKVVKKLLSDLTCDDPLSAALSELEQRLFPDPISTLATDPDINTASIFVEKRISLLRSRNGKYLTQLQVKSEQVIVTKYTIDRLSQRYLRIIRNHKIDKVQI